MSYYYQKWWIDPVAIKLGPISIKWYGVAYAIGFLLSLPYVTWIDKRNNSILTNKIRDDLLFACVIGILVGGRLGYVLLYAREMFEQPLDIIKTWEGGMSFHGGMLGFIIAAYIISWRHHIKFLMLTDLLASVIPIGLFLGRFANFINAELYGNITTMPWGIVFPNAGSSPRHPSQLYEAFCEGLLLGLILFVTARYTKIIKRRPGLQGILFLALYAIFRFICEFFRMPDIQIGYIYYLTMGQWLSVIMLVVAFVIYRFIPHSKS